MLKCTAATLWECVWNTRIICSLLNPIHCAWLAVLSHCNNVSVPGESQLWSPSFHPAVYCYLYFVSLQAWQVLGTTQAENENEQAAIVSLQRWGETTASNFPLKAKIDVRLGEAHYLLLRDTICLHKGDSENVMLKDEAQRMEFSWEVLMNFTATVYSARGKKLKIDVKIFVIFIAPRRAALPFYFTNQWLKGRFLFLK